MDKLSEVVEHVENLEEFGGELPYAPVEVRKCDRGVLSTGVKDEY